MLDVAEGERVEQHGPCNPVRRRNELIEPLANRLPAARWFVWSRRSEQNQAAHSQANGAVGSNMEEKHVPRSWVG
jgi:hypothetical protein